MSFNEKTWKKLEDRWDRGFDLLLPQEQETIAMWWLESETSNGTLDQFFWNSSGDLALIALSGLHRLNMPVTSKALESALARFTQPYPVNRTLRHAQLADMEARFGEALFKAETDVIQGLPEHFVEVAVDGLTTLYERLDLA